MCAPTRRGAFSKNECVPIQCGIHPSVRTLTMDGFHTPTSPSSVRLPLRALKTCGLCKSNVVVPLPLSNVNNDAHSAMRCACYSIEDLKLKDFPESGCLKIKNRMPRAKRAATAVTIRKIQDSDRSAACMPSFVLSHSLALSTSYVRKTVTYVRLLRSFDLFSYSFSLASPSNQLAAASPRPRA